MITAGGIQNTHYNLIDTLKQFMGSEWDRCYTIICDRLKNGYARFFLEYRIEHSSHPFIMMKCVNDLANEKEIMKSIDYPQPIRYTIVEAVVWHYINFEIKE